MKIGVLNQLNVKTRTVFRVHQPERLPMIGAACLAFLLASGGATQPTQAQSAGATTLYAIRDLGVVGANPSQPGQPLVISNNDWIAGGAAVGAHEHAVLWFGRRRIDIGDPGLGGNSFAMGVNQSGTAVGEAETDARGRSTTEDFCGFQAMGLSTSSTPCIPFVWREGKMSPLATLGGANGDADAINRWGAIAGFVENTTLDNGCVPPQEYQFKPVVWYGNDVQELPTRDDPDGIVFAINDWGEVVGASGTCAPFNPIWQFYLSPAHALLWSHQVAIDLGNLGGSVNNMAHAINNFGEVVGGSDLPGDQTSHAFLWTAKTKMQDLGTVGGDYYSFALGINDAGQIVGVSANADFSVIRAFVRRNGALVDLNTLEAEASPLYLMTACSINSRGEIIGLAIDQNTGETHGYQATPIPEH